MSSTYSGRLRTLKKHDLAQYVTGKAIDGVFKTLGAQEVVIRQI